MTVQQSSVKVSYAVSLVLAKAKNVLSESEIVKCAIEMAKAFGDEKMAKNFESVSLSRRTVARRIPVSNPRKAETYNQQL